MTSPEDKSHNHEALQASDLSLLKALTTRTLRLSLVTAFSTISSKRSPSLRFRAKVPRTNTYWPQASHPVAHAILRIAKLHRNYSIAAKANDLDIFVSPTELPWFPEGVMFVRVRSVLQAWWRMLWSKNTSCSMPRRYARPWRTHWRIRAMCHTQRRGRYSKEEYFARRTAGSRPAVLASHGVRRG